MGKSRIPWTQKTWNPTRGCSRVSPECDNCYAMMQARRQDLPGGAYEGLTTIRNGSTDWSGVVRTVPDKLDAPLRWRAPSLVFVDSMSDLFHESIPDTWIAAVFGIMAACERHTFQILTKRIARARRWFAKAPHWVEYPDGAGPLTPVGECLRAATVELGDGWRTSAVWSSWPLPNVWLLVSAGTQDAADERLPDLLQTPAAIRGVSVEPQLGRVDLTPWMRSSTSQIAAAGPVQLHGIDWVICGGESGRCSRPFNVGWGRDLREQCRAHRVAFYMKQLGFFAWDDSVRVPPTGILPGAPCAENRVRTRDRKGENPDEWPSDLRIRQMPERREIAA